jgi:hypothetical protein
VLVGMMKASLGILSETANGIKEGRTEMFRSKSPSPSPASHQRSNSIGILSLLFAADLTRLCGVLTRRRRHSRCAVPQRHGTGQHRQPREHWPSASLTGIVTHIYI